MKLIVTESEAWGGSVVFRAEDLEQEVEDTTPMLDRHSYAAEGEPDSDVDIAAILREAVEEIESETATTEQVEALRAATDFAPVDADIETAICAAEA